MNEMGAYRVVRGRKEWSNEDGVTRIRENDTSLSVNDYSLRIL